MQADLLLQVDEKIDFDEKVQFDQMEVDDDALVVFVAHLILSVLEEY